MIPNLLEFAIYGKYILLICSASFSKPGLIKPQNLNDEYCYFSFFYIVGDTICFCKLGPMYRYHCNLVI